MSKIVSKVVLKESESIFKLWAIKSRVIGFIFNKTFSEK